MQPTPTQIQDKLQFTDTGFSSGLKLHAWMIRIIRLPGLEQAAHSTQDTSSALLAQVKVCQGVQRTYDGDDI